MSERSRLEGALLPGTPGLLTMRSGTGYDYWYRRYNALPNQQVEDLVCKDGDDAALRTMQSRIAFSTWCLQQVRDLRRLGLQVADKDVSRLLVELHNHGLFDRGLVLVGTMAFMGWLNELGVVAVSARTQDVDLARRAPLKIGAPQAFLTVIDATQLKFFPVPGMPNGVPPTSVKRPGAEGLRVDVLVPGNVLGAVVPVPELAWHAQTVPQFDYLLADHRPAAALAGGHCIPVNLPSPSRFVWHKLYSSATRERDASKASKDLRQAATLAAVLVEQEDASFEDGVADVPSAVRAAARSRLPRLREQLAAHPQTMEQFERALRPAAATRRRAAE